MEGQVKIFLQVLYLFQFSRFSKDWMHSMADRLLNVLASNYTVLIYSGKLGIRKKKQKRERERENVI